MGWQFEWLSSSGSNFNRDFGVSFSKNEVGSDTLYNYGTSRAESEEMPGISIFAKKDGAVFHTYSTYARGLDMIVGTYHLLDLVPKGRDEDSLPWSMAWVKRHDEYEQVSAAKASCCCG